MQLSRTFEVILLQFEYQRKLDWKLFRSRKFGQHPMSILYV